MQQPVINIHKEIIERCQAGDREAFHELYRLYSKAMYNVACRITRNEDDAADILQEAFISAFRNLASYKGNATFGSWLKKIVVNKSINILKRRKPEAFPDDEQWDVPERAEEEYREELTMDKVKRAIHQLPEGYRNVLSLYLLEGYDHQEISEIMGITESTSKSQLNRAKSRLRELLTERVSS